MANRERSRQSSGQSTSRDPAAPDPALSRRTADQPTAGSSTTSPPVAVGGRGAPRTRRRAAAAAPDAPNTLVGAHFAHPSRDGRLGWNVELAYVVPADGLTLEQDPNSVVNVAGRVRASAAKGTAVLLRVDYKRNHNVPLEGDEAGVAQYLDGLKSICAHPDIHDNAFGIIVGNEPNLMDENGGGEPSETHRPMSARWYARVFNGRASGGSVRDNAITVIRDHAGANVRALVAGVAPWAPHRNADDPANAVVAGRPDVAPWLNYFRELTLRLQVNATAAIRIPDGFAIHTYGRPTDGDGRREPRGDQTVPTYVGIPGASGVLFGFTTYKNWRDIAWRVFPNAPLYITETNTRTQRPSSESYPKGWWTEALAQLRAEGDGIKCLCWFIDEDLPGWETESLIGARGRLSDAREDFDNSLS